MIFFIFYSYFFTEFSFFSPDSANWSYMEKYTQYMYFFLFSNTWAHDSTKKIEHNHSWKLHLRARIFVWLFLVFSFDWINSHVSMIDNEYYVNTCHWHHTLYHYTFNNSIDDLFVLCLRVSVSVCIICLFLRLLIFSNSSVWNCTIVSSIAMHIMRWFI